MSITPLEPKKENCKLLKSDKSCEDNNNTKIMKLSEQMKARTFAMWYKHMVDHERISLPLYLSDDATFEWFGKTIKTRKKISAFLKYDMHCNNHDFTTVEKIDKIKTRQECVKRKEEVILASPLHSPVTNRTNNKRLLRSNCNSPEWAEGFVPKDDCVKIKRKRLKSYHNDLLDISPVKNSNLEVDMNKGDFIGKESKRGTKRKCLSVTPPTKEQGQGDCLPSTSADSEKSHDTLNSQLLKLAVECSGFIESTRSRNKCDTDIMKWNRKCNLQVSYSEDPLNIGEYIIWAIRYSDESKCRRNLLPAFEAAAKEH